MVIQIPTEATIEKLAQMETYARIENKLTGEILWQNTAVLEVGDRNATQYTTYPYQADYQIVLYAIDSNSKMANLTDMKAYINEKHPLISKPDIVTDTTAADVPPDEAAQYERLAAHSVIGAPFGDRPTGFLVVRNPKRYPDKPDLVQMLAFVTLSSYYLLELQNGMQMMREASEDNPADTNTVTINLFGVPEIITSTGQINEEIYHSENGWKLLTFLALKKLRFRPGASQQRSGRRKIWT